MVVKASMMHLAIVETPVRLAKDGRSRPPHLKTWRDGWRHLRFLLLHSPEWLFLYPGLALVSLGLLGCALLTQGEVQLTPAIALDVHTLVVACFAILIGVQLVMFSALARRYGMMEGFLPRTANVHKIVLGMTLERLLRGALVILLLGVGGAVWETALWARSGFGPIMYNDVMRVLVPSLTAIAVATQLGASAQLATVFTIRRG